MLAWTITVCIKKSGLDHPYIKKTWPTVYIKKLGLGQFHRYVTTNAGISPKAQAEKVNAVVRNSAISHKKIGRQNFPNS